MILGENTGCCDCVNDKLLRVIACSTHRGESKIQKEGKC